MMPSRSVTSDCRVKCRPSSTNVKRLSRRPSIQMSSTQKEKGHIIKDDIRRDIKRLPNEKKVKNSDPKKTFVSTVRSRPSDSRHNLTGRNNPSNNRSTLMSSKDATWKNSNNNANARSISSRFKSSVSNDNDKKKNVRTKFSNFKLSVNDKCKNVSAVKTTLSVKTEVGCQSKDRIRSTLPHHSSNKKDKQSDLGLKTVIKTPKQSTSVMNIRSRSSVSTQKQCARISGIRFRALKSCVQSNVLQSKGILKKENEKRVSNVQQKHESGTCSKHVKFKKSHHTEQASLRSKLNDWLAAKGKTPSQCRHLICFDAKMSADRKKPKPVFGHLSYDVLDKQENSLKKEELNSRKRLFGDNKNNPQSCAPLQQTIAKSNDMIERKAGSGNRILTPSDASNKIKSPKVSFASAQKDDKNESFNLVSFSSPSCIKNITETDCLSPTEYPSTSSQDIKIPSTVEVAIPDQSILSNLNSMLQECITLFKTGCPVQNILPWLHEIDANIPQAKTFAPYYVCKAEVLGGNPQQVLDVLCQAVENNAQPCDVLAKAMQDLLSPHFAPISATPTSPFLGQTTCSISQSSLDSVDSLNQLEALSTGIKTKCETPVLQLQRQIEVDNDFGSTIKFCVTPISRLPGQTPESVPLAKITPMRRSLRFSNRQQTPYRKELDSISDLTLKEVEVTRYQPNPALID